MFIKLLSFLQVESFKQEVEAIRGRGCSQSQAARNKVGGYKYRMN